jgi:putative oxidoreductase
VPCATGAFVVGIATGKRWQIADLSSMLSAARRCLQGELMPNHRDNVAGTDAALLIARIALAAIFLYSGSGKLMNPAGFSGYLANHGFPGGLTYALALIAGAIETLGGIAILVGFQTRYAALLLAAFTLIAALIGHRFWDIADAAQRGNQLNHFWKNVAMIGGFLALYVAGAGSVSFDARRGRDARHI